MTLLHLFAMRREHIRSLLLRLAHAAPSEIGTPRSIVNLDDQKDDTAQQAYDAALIDLLLALGAIELVEQAAIRVKSVQAGYLLRMLAALLDTNQPLITDWYSEGVSSPPTFHMERAVDLLALLEQHRLATTPEAAPLRQLEAAIAVITRRSATDEREYLLHWDSPAGAWQLPGGRYEAQDESSRMTLLRELSEELLCQPLIDGQDVALHEIGRPFSATRLSPTYGLLTRTTFHVYLVQFISLQPPLHAGLRWLSENEILSETTSDGQRIAVPLREIIEQASSSLNTIL